MLLMNNWNVVTKNKMLIRRTQRTYIYINRKSVHWLSHFVSLALKLLSNAHKFHFVISQPLTSLNTSHIMVQNSEESQVSAQVSIGEQTDIPTNFGAGGEKIMTWNLEYFTSMDVFSEFIETFALLHCMIFYLWSWEFKKYITIIK